MLSLQNKCELLIELKCNHFKNIWPSLQVAELLYDSIWSNGHTNCQQSHASALITSPIKENSESTHLKDLIAGHEVRPHFVCCSQAPSSAQRLSIRQGLPMHCPEILSGVRRRALCSQQFSTRTARNRAVHHSMSAIRCHLVHSTAGGAPWVPLKDLHPSQPPMSSVWLHKPCIQVALGSFHYVHSIP